MLLQILMQILRGTPLWVYPLFFGLFLARALRVWLQRSAQFSFNHA